MLQVFRCPSSELGPHVADMHPSFVHATGYSTSDYKGCNGEGDNGIFFRRADGLGAVQQGTEMNYTRSRPQDVLDGLSKTIAFGESSYYEVTQLVGTTYNWDWPIWLGAYGTDEAVLFKTDANAHINCLISPKAIANFNTAEDDDCAFSWHEGGAFFAFADGSVHFLLETIDVEDYARLGSKNDGEIIRSLD